MGYPLRASYNVGSPPKQITVYSEELYYRETPFQDNEHRERHKQLQMFMQQQGLAPASR
ncbi:hypothetical protein [Alteromonas lipolytica]|uniref:hypothetical protein n=1 Tax=Alteromonas lipolytica TaxID=1856405 RepID=UPI0015868B42|nr:hypothetical protein [Alteromonas lipolytica]GGF66629.1 hypothetical protein GCM10011338_18520 [Alteromonas lipolytica]